MNGAAEKRNGRGWAVAVALWALMAAEAVVADAGHGEAEAKEEPPHGASMEHAHEEGHGEEAPHGHNQWLDPPPAYRGRRSDRWADPDAIARGARVFAARCQVCHGADGRGTGPLAGSLAHRPADLTRNFHDIPHEGDDYLFWRVSEGGTVEPFRSAGSQMPAFKSVLSEGEIWDVLAYVHVYYHLGLYQWRREVLTERMREEER